MLWPVASFTWVSDPGGSLLPYGKMYVYNGLEVLHWPFSYRLCKLSACNVSLWCITGFFYLHTVTTSGWTVETTSVTGHRPRTRIAHSPCLRSELSQQMSPSGPNPSKLVPLSFSAVRRSTVSTHTQNKFDPIMGHTSEGPNWYDRYALLFSRPDRYLLKVYTEGYRHHFLMPKSNLGIEHVGS